MKMGCVYMTSIFCSFFPLRDGTLYSFPGLKALKLHHGNSCNLDVYLSALVGTLRCVCVYTFDGYCLCLRSILVIGMDIQYIKSYLCIFFGFLL